MYKWQVTLMQVNGALMEGQFCNKGIFCALAPLNNLNQECGQNLHKI